MYEAYERSAEVYDLLYGQFVDYDANAERICELIFQRNERASTLLEVACGTGAYLERLAEHFQATGLDLSPAMLAAARRRLPETEFYKADMADFDLGATFDVVACLFSSIGYIQTLEDLHSTIACVARHLAPGGVAIVEPWHSPDKWQDGRVDVMSAHNEEMAVARVSTSRRDGRRVTLTWGFTVARADGRVDAFIEEHLTGQFTVDEHLDAFTAAGLTADYDPEGLMGRGLYVATRAG